MFQEIYVIDEQEELTEELKKMFKIGRAHV